MSLAKIGSAAAKIPPQGLMKMGDSGACLASVAHNVDENIPDDTPTCREHQEKFHTKTVLPLGSLGFYQLD